MVKAWIRFCVKVAGQTVCVVLPSESHFPLKYLHVEAHTFAFTPDSEDDLSKTATAGDFLSSSERVG